MLETYWTTADQEKATEERGILVRNHLSAISEEFSGGKWEVRGNGMLSGLQVTTGDLADAICDAAFADRLIVETCGAGGKTIKVLAPIVTSMEQLTDGLTRLRGAVASTLS
jgi:diaminobutyrate-2-oxoglutarate transaminase